MAHLGASVLLRPKLTVGQRSTVAILQAVADHSVRTRRKIASTVAPSSSHVAECTLAAAARNAQIGHVFASLQIV
jgi:hypothetical protein